MYNNFLTDADRIAVRKVTNGRTVVEFSVQYDALIDSRWRKVTRYDNKHGTPHQHIFGPGKAQYRQVMISADNNAALTEAIMVLKKSRDRS